MTSLEGPRVSKEQLCRDYMVLTEKITELYIDRDVPQSVQAYYLLCELIACGSAEVFIRTYGERPLNIFQADDGKKLLDLGGLDAFEGEAVEYLNSYLRGELFPDSQ